MWYRPKAYLTQFGAEIRFRYAWYYRSSGHTSCAIITTYSHATTPSPSYAYHARHFAACDEYCYFAGWRRILAKRYVNCVTYRRNLPFQIHTRLIWYYLWVYIEFDICRHFADERHYWPASFIYLLLASPPTTYPANFLYIKECWRHRWLIVLKMFIIINTA